MGYPRYLRVATLEALAKEWPAEDYFCCEVYVVSMQAVYISDGTDWLDRSTVDVATEVTINPKHS